MVPRFNYVLMVVLCVGLLAGVTALAVTFSGPREEPGITGEQIEALINRLGNPDDNIVYETRRALLYAGEDALPHLERAAKSPQAEIAHHASELILLIRESGIEGRIEP
jgi:hypothetical protein